MAGRRAEERVADVGRVLATRAAAGGLPRAESLPACCRVNEFAAILSHLATGSAYPAALATLVRIEGSSYRRAGARLLLMADGTSVGSLSGGCLEQDVLARCARVRDSRRSEFVSYDTREENDLVWGVGLGCHGVVYLLIEPLSSRPDWVDPVRDATRSRRELVLRVGTAGDGSEAAGTRIAIEDEKGGGGLMDRIPPPFRLLVFGAGEDARPLVRFGAELGWEVSVLDPRPALPTPDRFPEAVGWHSGPVDALLRAYTADPRTGAVIMTHHYVHDLPLLAGLRTQPLAYLGLLGPRARAERLRRDVDAAGGAAPASGPMSAAPVLHAPVGLDLGGDGPAAVALAIVAEIQCLLSGRDGRPLRQRREPIHPR